MFQGSGNLGKMEFIRLVEGNGGVLNGSTRFDFTNYFQIVPAHVLETVLWAEADRMKALAITQANLENQQGVVKNEVRDNVLNQPYGGFPWLTMPQVANTNWFNAHNFYGDLADLDAATLEDAKSFFDTYYAPNNAVLVVAGDFDPAAARAGDREVLRGDPGARATGAPGPRRAGAAVREAEFLRGPPGPAAGARARLAGAAAQHAGALRLQPARHDPAAGPGQPAVAEAGAGTRLLGRGRRRHQPARQRVHLRRPDAVDALPGPRPGRHARGDHRGRRRRDRAHAGRAADSRGTRFGR